MGCRGRRGSVRYRLRVGILSTMRRSSPKWLKFSSRGPPSLCFAGRLRGSSLVPDIAVGEDHEAECVVGDSEGENVQTAVTSGTLCNIGDQD